MKFRRNLFSPIPWLLLLVLAAHATALTYNVTTYGAVGNGSTDNTSALQNTLNAAKTAGGGTVVIPSASGSYLSGPLTLASNINFQLSAGATLQMLPFGTFAQNTSFVYGSGITNVSITGSGVMDGQGKAWWDDFNAGNTDNRPPAMIYLSKSTGVTLTGITVKDSPKFHIQLLGAMKNVYASGLSITAAWPSPNTDGIDLRGSNYLIENCYISDGDDVIQVGGSDATAGVTIRNCTFGTGHGLSIGGYTQGGVNNLLVDQCTFNGTQYGIRFKSGRDRGGLNQNLTYSNITMTNILVYPIYLTSWYPNSLPPTSDTSAAITTTTPYWNQIVFRNVTASAGTTAKGPAIFWAVPEAPVSNVLFDAVTLTGSSVAFNIHHAQGVTFNCNCRINGSQPPTNVGSYDAVIYYPACGSTATYTSTPTRTGTPTPTKTFTPTLTSTPTFTTTSTKTLTQTNSPTSTSTWTFTSTRTSSPTLSPTMTPTVTSTATKTLTSTLTGTPTFTATSTKTLTQTNTPTSTSTLTFTSTHTSAPTLSFTVTPTGTPTTTSTSSLTSTPMPVLTGTATPIFSSTVTNTRTSTPTLSSTATPTGTPTTTSTSSLANTATSSPTRTATPTFSSTETAAKTLTPTMTATATGTAIQTSIDTFTNTETSTPTETITSTWSTTDTPTKVTTPTSTLTLTNSASSTHTPSNTPTSTDTTTETPTNTESRTSSATATVTYTLSMTPTWTTTNTRTPTNTETASATDSTTPSLTWTVTWTSTSTPTLTRTVTATGTWTATASATASVTSSETPRTTMTSTRDRPCGSVGLSVAYPNPVKCSGSDANCVVKVDLSSSCPVKANWMIVSSGYRVLRQGNILVLGHTTVEWDLKDQKGNPVANGLYWFVLKNTSGPIRWMPILRMQ